MRLVSMSTHFEASAAILNPRLIAALGKPGEHIQHELIVSKACNCAHGKELENERLLGNPQTFDVQKCRRFNSCPRLLIRDFDEGGVGYHPSNGFVRVDVRRGRACWSS
jgi:hypothetical protein